MSQGQFTQTLYELNDGVTLAPIRVQPETLTFTVGGTANSAPAGSANIPVSASVSKSQRGYGIKARSVTITWTGAVPDGYDPRGKITLPILTSDLFDTINRGDAGAYLGSPVRVLFKSPERVG